MRQNLVKSLSGKVWKHEILIATLETYDYFSTDVSLPNLRVFATFLCQQNVSINNQAVQIPV